MGIRRAVWGIGLGFALSVPLACGQPEAPPEGAGERLGRHLDEMLYDVAAGAEEVREGARDAAAGAREAVTNAAAEELDKEWAEEEY